MLSVAYTKQTGARYLRACLRFPHRRKQVVSVSASEGPMEFKLQIAKWHFWSVWPYLSGKTGTATPLSQAVFCWCIYDQPIFPHSSRIATTKFRISWVTFKRSKSTWDRNTMSDPFRSLYLVNYSSPLSITNLIQHYMLQHLLSTNLVQLWCKNRSYTSGLDPLWIRNALLLKL